MAYKYFSHNGQVLPEEQAAVRLDNIEYSYGYGVYETVRLSNDKIHFLPEHCERLLNSAKIIDLDHGFSAEFVQNSVRELIEKNAANTCNIKILLIGGAEPNLYILCLNPLFPERKLYKTGVGCITYEYERAFPHAKSLNMLPSYLAYRQAKLAGAYEALLINSQGCITEGTRSNFFVIKDNLIIGAPVDTILPGVTRAKVLEVAERNGFEITEQNIKPADVNQQHGAFITSTSSKIMPVNKIGDHSFGPPPPELKRLIEVFDEYLTTI
jgi:branched-chain amino acid aminotransferase